MSDDEKVVGVLRRCDVCESKTVHVDGVCYEHRAKQPTLWTWHLRWIAPLVLAVLIYIAGALHVVYGLGGGIRVCSKIGWTLSDTFVDREALAANETFHLKVFAALDKCGAW